jgi:hypothetical protein
VNGIASWIAACGLATSSFAAADPASASPVATIRLLLSRVAPPTLEEIERAANGAEVTEKVAPAEVVELAWKTTRIALRRLSADETSEVRRQFAGATGRAAFSDKSSQPFAVFERVAQTRHVVEVEATAGSLGGKEAQAFVEELANATRALVTRGSELLDPAGRRLFAPDAAFDPKSEIPRFDSALRRRAKTRERLARAGVKIPEWLPPILGDEEVDLRDPIEVDRRLRGLLLVVDYSSGASRAEVADGMAESDVEKLLTPEELQFWNARDRDEERANEFLWRTEAIHTLLCCFRGVGDLSFPDRPASPDTIAELADKVLGTDANGPLLELRPLGEILDAADGVFCLQWAAVQASRGAAKAPEISLDLLVERRHALFWLIGHRRLDWDDIPHDT